MYRLFSFTYDSKDEAWKAVPKGTISATVKLLPSGKWELRYYV